METNFKPMLAFSDQVDLSMLRYPMWASTKLDGIRCIFWNGNMLSRSLKPIPSKYLQDKFADLKFFTAINKNLILDGELYSHDLNFQEITSCVMTKKIEDLDKINLLRFHCFDAVMLDKIDLTFDLRYVTVVDAEKTYPNLIIAVIQGSVENSQEVMQLYEKALNQGFEGLILKNPRLPYKFGRTTFKEQSMFKVKPYQDFDAKIIEVIQATTAKEGSERTINELGYSETSMKKDDRVLIDKAAAFLVEYEDKKLKVTIAATDIEKEEMWKNRDTYIGTWISYKAMMVGAKDVPRHPVFLRFRDDLKS
jgi:DNA ligase-1